MFIFGYTKSEKDMKINQRLTELAQAQELAKSYNSDVASVRLGEVVSRSYYDGLLSVRFLGCHFTLKNGETEFEDHDRNYNIEIGYKTPKGYKSKKQVPAAVLDPENVSDLEAEQLIEFCDEFKTNTFDPFYAQNQAARRNAAGWSYVAQNFMHDPYCTR